MTGTVNGFTINIPQLSLGGNAGGVPGFSLNFDFGANPTAMAQSAYSFVNTSFANDQSFLGRSISGTQDFLAHQIAPMLKASAAQVSANAGAIPDLYSALSKNAALSINAIQANVGAGLAAQTAASQASIASSNASAGGGGLCFITTAACEWEGLPDDCATLRKFRAFRDSYMREYFPDEIREYYRIAPGIVRAIKRRRDADQVWARVWCDFLTPAEIAIDARDFEAAHEIYSELVAFASECAGVGIHVIA